MISISEFCLAAKKALHKKNNVGESQCWYFARDGTSLLGKYLNHLWPG